MSDYDDDILLWSERQGALLRRLAAGERINSAELDWPNIAEEVESVGRSQLAAVRSLLTQSLAHTMKAEAWPDSVYAVRWRLDAEQYRLQAADSSSPSMRQHIDLEKLYRRALRWLPPLVDGQPPLPPPANCPVTLDELLRED